MHAVVNHLPIKPGTDWAELSGKADTFFVETAKAYPKLKAALLLRSSDTEAVFIGIYEDLATMQHVSSTIAAPWFAETIRPYLSGPAVRSAGAIVAGAATMG